MTRTRVTDIPWQEPYEIFACFAHETGSLFFDSARHDKQTGRYSFIAIWPRHIISVTDNRITLDDVPQTETNIFAFLRQFEKQHIAPQAIQNLPPFQGGLAGFLGYEIGHHVENLPRTPKNFSHPDALIGYYDLVFAFDHHEKRALLFSENTLEKQNKALKIIKNIGKKIEETTLDATWRSTFNRAEYYAATRRVIDYIFAGDVYQANLSQQFESPSTSSDHYSHYAGLRALSPAPFAAFQSWGDLTIASNSPERFLRMRGKTIETRPIKGTTPRSPDKAVDEKNKITLYNSSKNRAENLMIVDLLRNDIGRVCETGSVAVPELFKIESYANVHHMVSVVTGTLRDGLTATDLLEACFPGGSITGAPKIRAMEVIAELEPVARGPYCGSIFYIGHGQQLDSNILIRTLCYDESKVRFNVGGGIVADSTPEDEYQETLDKAASIFKSFRSSHQ